MPTILTIPEIIEIGRATTYLAANYTSKQALFGGSVIRPVPPVQVAFVTDALEWGYDGGAETDVSLRSTANYLYWLCGMFQLQAQQIINGGGGGSVTPTPSGGTLPNPYDYEVPATSSATEPIAAGQSSAVLTNFIGYNIAFNRGQVPQSTVDVGGSFYSWNRTTGLLTVSPAASLGELFQIIPIG